MQKINFKNLPDTSTPLNATNLNQMQDNIESAIDSIANLICPIGKVEVFFDNQDHSNYLGFTWERTSIGRVPVGIDENDEDFDTIGNTGGEKTHTLTIDEMPSHNHPINLEGTSSTGEAVFEWFSGRQTRTYSGTDLASKTGGNQPHNIIQPYEVMAFWKRIS